MQDKDKKTRRFQLLRGGLSEAERIGKGLPRVFVPGGDGTGDRQGRFLRRLSPSDFRALADFLHAKQEQDAHCRVLKEVCRELGGISCQIYLWDEEARRLLLSYYIGAPWVDVRCRRQFRLGQGYPGLVAVYGRPMVTRNLRDPNTFLRFGASLFQRGFYAAVPLITSDTLLGALQVVSLQEPPPHLSSPDLLSFLGRMLAIHLEREAMRLGEAEASLPSYLLPDQLLTELTLFLDSAPASGSDPATEDRVAVLTFALLRRLGWDVPNWREVQWACRLRDIGMFVVAPEVFRQRGPLTSEQREAVRKHPEVGCRFLERLPVSRAALDLVRHHHERFDGQGYPHGLAGEDIPRVARVVAVADAYNSMVSPRPYRAPRTPHQAMEEIERCAGSQFDPEVCEACLQLLAESVSRGG